MSCGLDKTVVSMLNVLNLIIELWLCKGMPLFLGNILSGRTKEHYAPTYSQMDQKKEMYI